MNGNIMSVDAPQYFLYFLLLQKSHNNFEK